MRVARETRGCPSANLLAAYFERRATTTERVELEQHFARCPDCCSVVAGLASALDDQLTRDRPRGQR